MPAQRLNDDAPSLQFQAEVTDIRLDSTGRDGQLWQVALSRTAFSSQTGAAGQNLGVLIATARSGATLEVVIERVAEDEAGELWHYIRKPLIEGTLVTGVVAPTHSANPGNRANGVEDSRNDVAHRVKR